MPWCTLTSPAPWLRGTSKSSWKMELTDQFILPPTPNLNLCIFFYFQNMHFPRTLYRRLGCGHVGQCSRQTGLCCRQGFLGEAVMSGRAGMQGSQLPGLPCSEERLFPSSQSSGVRSAHHSSPFSTFGLYQDQGQTSRNPVPPCHGYMRLCCPCALGIGC